MAEGTRIEWAHHTWSGWWGCGEIAPECGVHGGGDAGLCYAAVFAGRGLHATHAGTAAKGQWTGKITRSSTAVWQAPYKWPAGRVFASSMTDFWHEDVPLAWVDEALDLMDRTQHLTWMILTKRPGNVQRKLDALKRRLPHSAWLGATVGHRKSLPLLKPLLRVDVAVRFLSCEPLLTSLVPGLTLDGIGWLIAGGQSGVGKVAMTDPAWVRELRDLCQAASVPFFFKQWGSQANNPHRGVELDPHAKGGATLDGRLWREFPA